VTTDAHRAEELRVRYLTEAIQTSTPAGRLTMLLDALELDLAKADQAFADGADIKSISDRLIHAQDIVLALRDTLDISVWEPAARLKALYDHVYGELVMANLDKDRRRAADVGVHVSRLAQAWREAAGRAETSPATEPLAAAASVPVSAAPSAASSVEVAVGR
jgi:flagellar protein FliS